MQSFNTSYPTPVFWDRHCRRNSKHQNHGQLSEQSLSSQKDVSQQQQKHQRSIRERDTFHFVVRLGLVAATAKEEIVQATTQEANEKRSIGAFPNHNDDDANNRNEQRSSSRHATSCSCIFYHVQYSPRSSLVLVVVLCPQQQQQQLGNQNCRRAQGE